MEKYIQDRQNSIINNITKSFDNREEIIKGLDGEIIVYDEIYTPESINQFQKDLNKAFSNGKLTQEEFEKSKKDLSRLAMRQVFDKNGHKRIVYVKIHEDEHGNTKETDFDKEDLVKFTKDGKEFSGKIKSLKFHDKTDKVGTAMVDVDGKTYSVSLSKLEHHEDDEMEHNGKVVGMLSDEEYLKLSKDKLYKHKEFLQNASKNSDNRMSQAMVDKHKSRLSIVNKLLGENKTAQESDSEVKKNGEKIKSKLDIHEDGKKIAKFHGLSDKEYSEMHPNSKTELKNSYKKYKEESNKQNNDILKRSQDAKKLREENTIMQEVGGQDGWNGKAKAIHLAKYIGKDEDFIKNLNQWKVGSSTIDAKLKGLEKEYLDWEKTKIDNATITYKNKFDEIVTTETKGMTPKEIKNHIGGTIISIKSPKPEKKEDPDKEKQKLKEQKILETNKKNLSKMEDYYKSALKQLDKDGHKSNHPNVLKFKESYKSFKELSNYAIKKIGKKYNLYFDIEHSHGEFNEFSMDIGFDKYELADKFPEEYEKASPSLSQSKQTMFAASKSAKILNELFNVQKFSSSGFSTQGGMVLHSLTNGGDSYHNNNIKLLKKSIISEIDIEKSFNKLGVL